MILVIKELTQHGWENFWNYDPEVVEIRLEIAKFGWNLKLLKILTLREQKILPDLQNIEKNIELLKNPQNIEIIENIALYHLWTYQVTNQSSSQLF